MHQELIPFNQRLYDLPNGKVGKEVCTEIATLFEEIQARTCNAEKLMVFIPVILQKTQGVKGAADVRKRITS